MMKAPKGLLQQSQATGFTIMRNGIRLYITTDVSKVTIYQHSCPLKVVGSKDINDETEEKKAQVRGDIRRLLVRAPGPAG